MEIIATGKRRNQIQLRETFLKKKREIREAYESEKHLKGKMISWIRMQARLIATRFEVYGNDKNY